MASSTYTGFIDAGFLRAEGARALGESPRNVRLDAEAVVAWYKDVAYQGAGTFLRAYWYDARFEQGHDHADGQRRFFAALAQTAGIQLRLGRIVEHRPWFEPGIRDALRRTATGLGLDPSSVMEEFDRNWTFRPERRQKRCGHPGGSGPGPPGRPPGLRHGGAHLGRPRPRRSGAGRTRTG